MSFEDILAVLHGWMGIEIEVGTHGGNGRSRSPRSRPVGDSPKGMSSMLGAPHLFTLTEDEGIQVASFRLVEDSFAGGGWFDDAEEVIEVRSGVIQILIAPVEEQD